MKCQQLEIKINYKMLGNMSRYLPDKLSTGISKNCIVFVDEPGSWWGSLGVIVKN